jgi:hypothetical protein
MKRGTKKTMRVATTFTGAAACAFAFAPTAMAGAQPGVAHGGRQPLPRGNNRNVRPDKITYDLSCPGGTSNWVHLAYYSGGDACLGFTGYSALSPIPVIKGWCGGNNKGVLYGISKNGARRSHPFGHGHTYATIKSAPFAVTSVKMNGWSGNSKCGPP